MTHIISGTLPTQSETRLIIRAIISGTLQTQFETRLIIRAIISGTLQTQFETRLIIRAIISGTFKLDLRQGSLWGINQRQGSLWGINQRHGSLWEINLRQGSLWEALFLAHPISPHCDLDPEDSNATFLHDTPAHDEAPPYQVWLQEVQRFRR